MPKQYPTSLFKTGEINLTGNKIQVLDTDYTNYVVWHVCYTQSGGGSSYETITTATRDLLVKAKYVALMNDIISRQVGVDPTLAQPMIRLNCKNWNI